MNTNSFLNRLTDFVEKKVAPPLIRISKIRYLEAMQAATITIMPYMILGATATLVLNLPGLFSEGSGLNLPQVAEFLKGVIDVIRQPLLQMVFTSINILALLTSMISAYALGQYYNEKDSRIRPIVAGVLGMVAFLSFIDFFTLSENFDWPTYIFGAPSLLGAVLIAFLSVEGYRLLVKANWTIKMPDSVPPMIADAFTSLLPVTLVVIVASFLGSGLGEVDLLMILNNGASKLVQAGSTVVPQGIAFFLDRLLWFVGLHGSNIVGNVMNPVWTTMITENIAAFANNNPVPHMFTNQWINFYVRVSVLPIAILAMRSKVKRYQVLGKLSLPGTIFNIAEPIMYGLPIVLNPFMFVPWVLGFTVTYIFNVFLSMVGLAPAAVAHVVWTMPAPIAAFIGSGFKWIAPITSILNYVIVYFMFLPFFRVMEREELKKEQEMQSQLEEA